MKWIPRNTAGTIDIRRRLALLLRLVRLRMMKGEEIIIYFSSIGLEIEDYQLISTYYGIEMHRAAFFWLVATMK